MPNSFAQGSPFVDELLSIREQVNQSLSKKDFYHLKKIIWINRILLLVGFATAWIIPNPFNRVLSAGNEHDIKDKHATRELYESVE